MSTCRVLPSSVVAAICSSSGSPSGMPAETLRPWGVTTTTRTPGGASLAASMFFVVSLSSWFAAESEARS